MSNGRERTEEGAGNEAASPIDGLESQQSTFASILDLIDDGIVVFDSDLHVRFTSPAARRLLGIADEMQTLGELLRTSSICHLDALLAQLPHVIRDRREHAWLLSVRHEQRVRPIHFLVRPFPGHADHYVALIRDASTIHQLAQMELMTQIVQLGAAETTLRQFGQQLVNTIAESLRVDVLVFATLDQSCVRPLGWHGVALSEEAEFPLAMLDAMRGELEQGHPVIGPASLRWPGMATSPRLEATIPLISRGKLVGILYMAALATESAILPRSPGQPPALDDVGEPFLVDLGTNVAASMESVVLYEEVAIERAQLRTVVENVPHSLLLFNRRTEVVLLNEEGKTLSGRQNWERVGDEQNPFVLCDAHGNPVEPDDLPFVRAARTGEGFRNVEYQLDFGTFRRHILLNVIPVPGEDDRPASFVATAQDITERREYEQRKDDFLSIASHELRRPLTPLTGFLQMMCRQADEGEAINVDLLRRAEQQVHRLRRMIDGLLDMTRIETGRLTLAPEQVELGELLAQAIDPWLLAHDAEPIELALPERPLVARLDPDRLIQVVSNVIDNAIKHGQSHGPIRVRLSREAENQALICVEDNGHGMDAETLAHVFDRYFHRGDSPGRTRSLGLGLFISREIVELHGGSIEIDSCPGGPTRVYIRLPLSPEPRFE